MPPTRSEPLVPITVRISKALRARLQNHCREQGRNRHFVMGKALKEWLDLQGEPTVSETGTLDISITASQAAPAGVAPRA